jgi:hypothetical protein
MLPHWKLWAVGLAAFFLAAGDLFAGPPVERKLAAKAPGPMIVHEWGTFLSVQGSDGVTLGGMVDSEEELPPFVRERDQYGNCRIGYLSKMETPVTYFYVDHPCKVRVRVDMPEGLLTHWFPAVSRFGPPPEAKGKAIKAPAGGSFLDWGQVELIPDASVRGAVPGKPVVGVRSVGDKDTWRFARQTDAAFVKVAADRPHVYGIFAQTGELEKFLFYRGLGTFEQPLQVQSTGGDREEVRLILHNLAKDTLKGIFAIRVEKGTIQFAALPDLAGGRAVSGNIGSRLSSRMLLKDGVAPVKQAVAAALIQGGLYAKEAQAMVDTWERSYFRSDGLRLLYILPRSAVDVRIPIRIEPAPEQLVRVMVGRIEVLTPAKEKQVEKTVADLGAKDPQIKKAAAAELAKLGRLQEPILRRVAQVTADAEVRSRAETIVKSFER